MEEPQEPTDEGAVSLPGRAVISLDAIRDNTRVLSDMARGAQVMAVVKANAYGHGLIQSAHAAIAGGATYLGVAQVSEALELDHALGLNRPAIFTWIYSPNTSLDIAVTRGLEFGVSSTCALNHILGAARRCGRSADIHLKFDSGLGRAGAPLDTWSELVRSALRGEAEGYVRLIGFWSHFACADMPSHKSIDAQEAAFSDALAIAKGVGAKVDLVHFANSAALITKRAIYDMVRPGLALYGLSPIAHQVTSAELGLIPAMTLETELILVKHLPEGYGISYGHTYRTPSDTVTGLVPLGYSDGISRAASGCAPVQIAGRRLQITGRVCMDQFVVDLGFGARECEGERVIVFGPGLDGEPTAQDWADATGTITNEIVTRLPRHFPRVYVGLD